MGFSRILLKSLLEISFDKKLCLWVNKSSYCSLWGRPGFAQETLCSLERRKCYAELWFTLITWLQQQDGKTFEFRLGKDTLFCTESTLKRWTSARAVFQGSCLSEWAEGQMLQQGWNYWLICILWHEFKDSCILLNHLLPKICCVRPLDLLFWIEVLVLCTQIALALRSSSIGPLE